ncbi:hypothetical protein QBC33DRAFT_588567 [Phialemonium atrogriseum]|uniref:Letm1 RBD domain-containing protein n=1 Tax=Phialemonium atrogriseum TaxID=1093897 RepID=A0AAJ0BY41_9PEZI|nr:uncharacterized protein QBC33DRAFT_588567 [Phialemonium atrogriseum]KAK1766435.1 hypothetical protein QBC33DRAFT_588567 [Phialemonium atrogriseum]
MRLSSHTRVLRGPVLTTRNYASISPVLLAIASIPRCQSSRALHHGRHIHFSATPPRLSAVPQPQHKSSTVETTHPPLQTPIAPQLSPTAANPPATTRPPPLDLPTRQPETSTFSHLLATAKAYVAFYKTGLRHIYTNTRLVWSSQPGNTSPPPGTRAHLLLHERWRHDARRVPLFALMLLVCGEFTPLVVLAVPRIAPLTCRIPAQVSQIRRHAEGRRRCSADALRARVDNTAGDRELPYGLVVGHMARSLGVVSPLWDRVGWVPASLAGGAAGARLRFLARDDALLVRAGGVPALEAEEVELACADRGIGTLGRTDGELRDVLARWLALTAAHDMGAEESTRRMMALLMQEERAWPNTWPEAEGAEKRGS